jgi:hypothetical protein
MSVPLSCFGGLDVPIRSFNLALEGTKFVIAAIGARFTMRDPLPPVTWLALAAVRPDTVELILAPLEALGVLADVEDPVETVPGMDADESNSPFLG